LSPWSSVARTRERRGGGEKRLAGLSSSDEALAEQARRLPIKHVTLLYASDYEATFLAKQLGEPKLLFTMPTI